jgi:hypothetical protein
MIKDQLEKSQTKSPTITIIENISKQMTTIYFLDFVSFMKKNPLEIPINEIFNIYR